MLRSPPSDLPRPHILRRHLCSGATCTQSQTTSVFPRRRWRPARACWICCSPRWRPLHPPSRRKCHSPSWTSDFNPHEVSQSCTARYCTQYTSQDDSVAGWVRQGAAVSALSRHRKRVTCTVTFHARWFAVPGKIAPQRRTALLGWICQFSLRATPGRGDHYIT